MTADLEVRASTELRAVGRRLSGYAATFGTSARIGTFTEILTAGCFAAGLSDPMRDVLALLDHDTTKLLARQKAGTLRLSEDVHGLAFEIDLPSTTLANDVLAQVEARNLQGMSFSFRVRPGGEIWPTRDRRELRAVDLYDVSVVTHPAYPNTVVSARNRPLAGPSDALRRARVALL